MSVGEHSGMCTDVSGTNLSSANKSETIHSHLIIQAWEVAKEIRVCIVHSVLIWGFETSRGMSV